MSIHDKLLFGKTGYETAVERIRAFCTSKRVLCAFSGGKDSQACYHLLEDSGVDFHAEYSVTRFEPPELIRFIRANYPDVTFRRAYKKSLIDEIKTRGLPNRWARWCCNPKHVKTEGYDIAVIGIRWDESAKRRESWRMFGYKQDKTAYLCPIVNWSTKDVWEFLGDRPHCSLYDEGFKRIGCVCCPLASNKIESDALRWPKTAAMLRKGADAFVQRMRERDFVTAAGKNCASWYASENPEGEYWNRWVKSGQTSKPADSFFEDQEGDCLFSGSGFSESDGNEESEVQ